MNISVIVPAFNAGKTIALCLEALNHQTISPLEIIVVDDNSSDDTVEIARTLNVRIITQTVRRGAASARNRGAEIAAAETLVFVDADVQVPPDALAQITGWFNKMPDLACVCGIYAKEPLLKKNFIASYRSLQSYFWKKSGCGLTTRFTVSCGAIKKAVFEEIGGFNEAYTNADIEDYEMGHKITTRGYAILQTESIQSRHDDISSFNTLAATLFRRAFLYPALVLRRRKLDTGYLNKRRMVIYPLALLALISLPLSSINRQFFMLFLALTAGIIILDYGLYRTFAKEKGFIFMLKSIPVHFSITIIMGMAFLAGSAAAGAQKINCTRR